jgi:uncharacterized membrane protein
MIQTIGIIIVAILGFAISAYIYYKKTRKEELVCIIGDHDCNSVVTSKYSTFLRIPLEVWGLLYYGAILFYYISNIFIPLDSARYLSEMIIGLSFLAFLMSIYFIYVWTVLLKEYCEWCIASVLCTIAIFGLIVFF